MQMVMFVLDDPNRLDEILEAWEAIGVSGVTIVESTGIHRWRAQRVRVPFRYGFQRLVESQQEGHYTLFTIVKGEETVRRCIAAAENVVGDLDTPNSGVIASWPLSVVKGVPAEALGSGSE